MKLCSVCPREQKWILAWRQVSLSCWEELVPSQSPARGKVLSVALGDCECSTQGGVHRLDSSLMGSCPKGFLDFVEN